MSGVLCRGEMDNCARVHILAAFFGMEPNDFRKIASSWARNDSEKYGSPSHVGNLFVRETKPRKGSINATASLCVGARFETSNKQAVLFREVTSHLCDKNKIGYSPGLSLDSKPEEFLKSVGARLDHQEVLSCLHPIQYATMEYYSNLAIANALGLPPRMHVNRAQLSDKIAPWEGRYAVYRISSTRVDEVELSEELLEIEMSDSALCRFYGHGGGHYEGILIYSDQVFTSTLSHASSKIDNHVYFFLSMSTLPVKGRSVFFGTLTMSSDYNDMRFYQVMIVKKRDEFVPRGRDIRDPQTLLKVFPALSQVHRSCERHEGPYRDEEIQHPVFVTNRSVVNDLLLQGDKLYDAYASNEDQFPDVFSNLDIILKADEIVTDG